MEQQFKEMPKSADIKNNVAIRQDLTSKYADIIKLPHHVSTKHPRLSVEQRAAQFAPFAPLHGDR